MAGNRVGDITFGTRIDNKGLNEGLKKAASEADKSAIKMADNFKKKWINEMKDLPKQAQTIAKEAEREFNKYSKAVNKAMNVKPSTFKAANKYISRELDSSLSERPMGRARRAASVGWSSGNAMTKPLKETASHVFKTSSSIKNLTRSITSVQTIAVNSSKRIESSYVQAMRNCAASTKSYLENATSRVFGKINNGIKRITTSAFSSLGRRFSGVLTKMEYRASNFANKISRLFMTAFTLKYIGQGLASLSRNAGQFEQAVEATEVLFGQSADRMQENAFKAYRTAGVSAEEYLSQANSFANRLLQDLGGDTEAAADIADMAIKDMSDNWHLLGGDFKMIQNAYMGLLRGQYRMFDNLKLGYGQTKAEVERLLEDAERLSGIHYDINSLADIIKAIHVIQQQTKITGTTEYEAVTTWAGALQMLRSSWKNFRDTFGQGIIYLLQPLLKVISIVSDALTSLGLRFMKWAYKIMGIKEGLINRKGQKDLNMTASAMENVGTGVGNTGTKAKKATKAVKELKKELMGFDQINKLTGEKGTDNDTGTTGDSGTGIGGGVDLGDGDPNWDEETIWDKAKSYSKKWYENLQKAWDETDWTMLGAKIGTKLNDVITKIQELNFGGKLASLINAASETLYSTIETIQWKQIGTTIAEFITNLVNGIDWELAGRTVANGVDKIVLAFKTMDEGINWSDLTTKFATFINTTFKDINWGQIGETISNALHNIFSGINNLLDKTDFVQIGKAISDFIVNIDFKQLLKDASGLAKNLLDALIEFMNGIDWYQLGYKIIEAISGIDWKGLLKSLCVLIVDAFGAALLLVIGAFVKIGEWLNEHIFGPIIKAVTGFFDPKKEASGTLAGSILASIVAIGKNVISKAEDSLKNIIAKLIEYIPKMINKVGEIKTGFVNKVVEIKNSVVAKFGEIKDSVVNKIGSLKDSVVNKIVSLKDAIVSKFKSLAPSFTIKIPTWADIKGKINEIKDKIKNAFSNAKIKFSIGAVASWAYTNLRNKINNFKSKHPKLGAMLPDLPKLAQGGFVKANTPQLAIIGDNKREGEIVAPESKLAAMAAQAAGSGNDETNALLRQLIGLVASMNLNVELDGEAIKNNTVRRINNHTRSTGQLEILI